MGAAALSAYRSPASGLLGVLLLAASGLSVAIDTGPAFEDPELQRRYEDIIGQVRCLTCQNQSIKDSNAFLAADLRREIREQLAAGASNQDIFDFLTARYGEFALYKPPLNARTMIVWAAPPVLLIGAGVIIVRIVRRRSRLPLDDETETYS